MGIDNFSNSIGKDEKLILPVSISSGKEIDFKVEISLMLNEFLTVCTLGNTNVLIAPLPIPKMFNAPPTFISSGI